MSKKDDISKLYQPSKILEKICTCLFCADVLIALLTVCSHNNTISYLTVVLIIIAFLYMALSVINDGFFWFCAESARRKDSIQSAFNVNLVSYKTQGYYNNNIDNPELSYAANLFESAFFTKEISGKMMPGAVIKVLIAMAVLIMSCRLIPNNDILLIVAQTVFSAVVVENNIQLIIFAYRIKTLYEAAYHEFVTVGISKKEQLIWLRFFCTEYESVKAHYRVRLSESLYKKLNPGLSKEWEKILKEFKITI